MEWQVEEDEEQRGSCTVEAVGLASPGLVA